MLKYFVYIITLKDNIYYAIIHTLLPLLLF